MVNWYKNLYVGDTAKKKQKKWMRRIENKKAVPGVWLLTLPSNQQNNLDVIPADLLLQPDVRRNCPMIVGLAVSREEAFAAGCAEKLSDDCRTCRGARGSF